MHQAGKACPNCGHRLVRYRTEEQTTVKRDVVVQWLICSECRHVSLQDWRFTYSAELVPSTGSA